MYFISKLKVVFVLCVFFSVPLATYIFAESKKPIVNKTSVASPLPAGKYVLYFSEKFKIDSKYVPVNLVVKEDGSVIMNSKKWVKEVPVKFSGELGKEEISFTVDGDIFQGEVRTIALILNGQKMPPNISVVGLEGAAKKLKWQIQCYEVLKHEFPANNDLW